MTRFFLILLLFPLSNSQAVERMASKLLDFQESTHDEKLFPGGCGNPYAEAVKFRDFYDNSLAFMAARRGAHSKGIVDLFAVGAIRDEISLLFPSYTEESPIDRLVMAQLCQFQKIAAQGLGLGDKPLAIGASDSRLHDHLVMVSKKMYSDARALLLESIADLKKKEKEDAGLRLRFSEVLRAREESRDRVRGLLD